MQHAKSIWRHQWPFEYLGIHPYAASPFRVGRIQLPRPHRPQNWENGDREQLTNVWGSIVSIKLNNKQELIGAGGGLEISEDSGDQFADIKSAHPRGDDAICIATITFHMAEGTRWGWTCDWCYWCGLNWFSSEFKLQNDQEQDPSPMRTWIDNDHTNDQSGQDWDQLERVRRQWRLCPGNGRAEKQCGNNMLAWDDVWGQQILPAEADKRRSGIRRSQRSDDRLVVSRLKSHNATEVCQSWTSCGFGFVSEKENIYCSMETDEASPLCNGADKTIDCFNLNTSHGPAMIRVNGKRSPRNSTKVIVWE
ncbi:hypothetical protein HJFPF1_12998 [Paramyrothecium foliicola]|nr:hypothetical protein HJFPF1_12998 [Paramyrothecium foliicola]